MDNWQQVAYREDPYGDIPFDDGRRWSPDLLVGIVCILAALVAALVAV